MKQLLFFLLAAATLPSSAEPITVRQAQGATRGFLVVRSAEGRVIGHADVLQSAHGDRVTTRLVYHFNDGSVDDEISTYTQRGVFRLISDHHIQRGPFFKRAVDAHVTAATGEVHIVASPDDNAADAKTSEKQKSLPPDVANGMIGTLLLNVPATAAPFKVSYMASLGKGRLIQLAIAPEGKGRFSIAGVDHTATIFRIKIELGGITGAVAPVLGKQPPDVLVWVFEDEVPTLVRQIGPLADGGPVVDVQLAGTTFEQSPVH